MKLTIPLAIILASALLFLTVESNKLENTRAHKHHSSSLRHHHMSRQGDFFKNCYANKALACAAWLFCKTANQGLSKTIGEVKKVWAFDKKDPSKNPFKLVLERYQLNYSKKSNVKIAGALSTHDFSKFSWDQIQEFLILKLGDPSTNRSENALNAILKDNKILKEPHKYDTSVENANERYMARLTNYGQEGDKHKRILEQQKGKKESKSVLDHVKDHSDNIQIAAGGDVPNPVETALGKVKDVATAQLSYGLQRAVKNSVVDHMSKGSVRSNDHYCSSTGEDLCHIPDEYQMQFCA